MKTLNFVVTTLVCLLSAIATAQNKPQEEVLFIGDSWVAVPCFIDEIDNAFFNRGVNMTQGDCLSTSQIGVRADNYKVGGAPKAYAETMRRLATRPYIKAVYISLGGNDMFKYWTTTMGSAAETALYNEIKGHIAEIIRDIHAIRPDVWVLVSGYDNGYMYANNPISAYRNIYVHMGSPTPAQVYGGFSRFYQTLATLAGDHTVFQQHVGVMHYYYGAPEANVGPFQTLAPSLISQPGDSMRMGGVPGVRNNKYAMAHIFNFYFDPHHLRPKGFMRLFEHGIDTYIGHWLMGASYQAPSADKDAEEDLTTPEPSDDVQQKVEQMVNDAFDKIYDN